MEGRVLWWFLTQASVTPAASSSECQANCFYRGQRQRTQFEFPSSLSAQSCMLALTSAPPDACRPVPVDSIQERGPPAVGPMLRIVPRLSCPHAHWSFLILEFLRLTVDGMSVCHQSSYVKILTLSFSKCHHIWRKGD